MEAQPVMLVLLLSLLVFGSSGATENALDADTNESRDTTSVASRSDYSASQSTGAVSIPPTVVTVFAVIGAVVVAILAAGGISAIILSLFGIRVCYVLGTCHDPYGFIGSTPYEMPYPAYAQIPYPTTTYHAKSSDGSGNDLPQYDAYSQVSYPTTYQKRSLDYVGPILKVLGSAYGQQYGQQYYGHQNGQLLPGTPRKTVADLPTPLATETNLDNNEK